MLEKETKTYKKILPSLLNEQGKYAVIFNEDLIGIYESYEDALKFGYQKCGINPFLVKRIMVDQNISYFSRDISISCPQ